MDESMRIIDYIVDQADRYDSKNYGFEKDIIRYISNRYDTMVSQIMSIASIYGDIPTIMKMEVLIGKIESSVRLFNTDVSKYISENTRIYFNTSYNQMDDLIDLGFEIERKARSIKALEIKGRVYDKDTIEFISRHSMEQVTWMSANVMNSMRSMFGELVIAGRGTKPIVRERLQSMLPITKSKAEEIAQTELSMAYNAGALSRIEEFNSISTQKMQKYWHGFKYSETTCTRCRPKIGNIYDYNDNSEKLPAHPRCRCVWLPFIQGWDKPISKMFYSRANMLNRVYTPADIYARINMRLGITYADNIPIDLATKYVEGDRTNNVMDAITNARDFAIDKTKNMFDIGIEKANERMSNEFNTQISFWKGYVAQNVVDNNIDQLSKSYEAIKGLMILPWSGQQLDKFNSLLLRIKNYI